MRRFAIWIYDEVLGRCRAVGGGLFALYVVLLLSVLSFTRNDLAVSNIIARGGAKRPVVNTDVLLGNRSSKAVASFGNGCSVPGIPSNTALIFDCVNVGARRIGIATSSGLSVSLRRSGRLVSRIIIVNCNVRHGSSLANSMNTIGDGSLAGITAPGITGTLRKHISNICVSTGNTPKDSPRMHVHNVNAAGGDGPLCIISNVFVSSVSFLDARSVRSVRILGSTSTATVCNSHNTGNIVVIAAGRKARKGTIIGFATDRKFRFGGDDFRVTGTARCTALLGRTLIGANKGPGFSSPTSLNGKAG